MKTVPLCLLTVIAESVLKERLVHDLRSVGARGYTLTDAEGEGSRQRRVGEIFGANIRIESIVSPEVADRLLQLISNEYFDRFAVIAYLSTVSVIRGEKYV
ncbi:MAG: transcriptional regulator [Planctomycetota bacterium]|jgi:nitrogen regulatory protein P-II 2|nr:transcriptional regulator [Planctomycetota bacterium]